jgi:acylphosphatase
MDQVARAHILIQGRVQGVAYRAFAYDQAFRYGLNGWVRNLEDGRVELEVEGDQAVIGEYLGDLKKGPPVARVDQTVVEWVEPTGQTNGFHVRR